MRKLKAHLLKKANGGKPAKKPDPKGGNHVERKATFGQDHECAACKKAGRKHRHDPKKCKFAPGGEWHGKSKDELRALQKKYYEKINKSRQAHAQTHQIEQLKKRKKLRGSTPEGNSSSEDSDKPMWRREVTLTVDQHHPGGQPEFTIKRHASSENEMQIPEGAITPGVLNDGTTSSQSEIPDLIGYNSQSDGSESSDTESTEESTMIGGEETVTEMNQVDDPGVTTQEPNGEEIDCPEAQNTNMDVEDLTSPAAASAAIEPKKGKEVIDLTATTDEEPEASASESSGHKPKESSPMTTEEFLDKRAKFRRGEWTKAKESNDAAPAENKTENQTDQEPTMFIGPTFSGPPLFGPLRAVSLAAHMMAMSQKGASKKTMEAEARKVMPVCYMMNEAPSSSKASKTPKSPPKRPWPEDTDERMAMFWVTPCAGNGVPYPPGVASRFATFLDISMKNGIFRELQYAFPLEPNLWKVLVNGRELKGEDTPESLGMKEGDAVEAKLLMLSGKSRRRWSRDPRVHNAGSGGNGDESAAAAASAVNPHYASASSQEPEVEESMDVSLEVWRGLKRRCTVRWGRHRHMWPLMSALSVVCQIQNHHLIIRTMQHVSSGVGCVVDTDSPHSLCLQSGDRLVIHHLPNLRQITPHFTPSLAVAERILKISGFQIHTDKESVDRGSRSVGSDKGYVKSTNLTLKTKSTSKYTESQKTPIEFSQKTSKNKRKTLTPIRRGDEKRIIIPPTSPHMRRNHNSSLSHRITRVTEPFIDTLGVKSRQKPYLETCDPKNSQFRPIQLVQVKNPLYKSRRQNIDFGGIVRNYVKNRKSRNSRNFTRNFTSKLQSQSKSQNEESFSESESEDLLKPRKPIRTNLGPNKRSYDPNKTVYTPDMRYPFQKEESLGPESYRDNSFTMTNEEITPENNSLQRRNHQEDDSSINSLSTTAENSDSTSVTEGSLPEKHTEPRSDPHKEMTMVTKHKTEDEEEEISKT